MNRHEALKILLAEGTERVKCLADQPHRQERLVSAIEAMKDFLRGDSDTEIIVRPLKPSDTHG